MLLVVVALFLLTKCFLIVEGCQIRGPYGGINVDVDIASNLEGYEAWEVGKIIAKEKVNREVMYKVLKSIWFTNDEVCFVALNEEVFLVKFESIEIRIFNIPLEQMDRQMAIEVGSGKSYPGCDGYKLER
ncbi:hypothetical protein GOBAR_DD04526 [Gossypium barbadense]|nr:hypothetical protein GOBAR_DD04526 [Gossypium barbadense]